MNRALLLPFMEMTVNWKSLPSLETMFMNLVWYPQIQSNESNKINSSHLVMRSIKIDK